MISSFIKVKIRNYRKRSSQFVTEVAGMALALSCFVLISVYVEHERSYDNFHQDAARIYRLSGAWGPEQKRTAIVPNLWAGEIAESFPEVEVYTRVRKMLRFAPLVSTGDRGFYESNFITADSTFFSVFSYELLKGDRNTALDDARSIVLTESKAIKIFGNTDVLGSTLTLDKLTDYKVTGILKDIPTNSHMHFEFIIPIGNLPPGTMLYSFFKLPDNFEKQALESKTTVFLKESFPPANATREFTAEFQSLQSIHLFSDLEYEFEPKGNETYLDLLQLVAWLILATAIFNFINISIASSSLRIKEYAVRKVLGGIKTALVGQFVVEALLAMSLTVVVTALIVTASLPFFTSVVRIDVDIQSYLIRNLPVLVTAFIAIGSICGAFPALMLMGKDFITLRGKFSSGGKSKGTFRRVLVGIQLAASFILVTGTIVIVDQLSFMRSKDLGFDKEQVIIVNARALRESTTSIEFLKSEFASVSKVLSVSLSQTVPGDFSNMANIAYTIEGNTDPIVMRTIFVDHDFINTLGIKLSQGRNFNNASDTMTYIINEAAAQRWETVNPLNSEIQRNISDMVKGPVVGIMENFHFASLHNEIEPLVLAVLPGSLNKVIIRVQPGNVQTTIADVENTWKRLFPDYPFQYEFLDDLFGAQYKNDDRFSTIFTLFTIIAVLLSCLGLYGMVSIDTNRKAREIGVRKVFGASDGSIVALLLRTVLQTSVLSVAVGIPFSYWLMTQWLQNFSYAVGFSLENVLLGGFLVIAIAGLTSIFIVLKSARTNPTETLKAE